MIPNEIYQKKVENLVVELSKKYINRKDIFEPLSKILPNYWNSIFLSAVKQIMFKRVYIIPAAYTDAKLIWVVKDPSRGAQRIAHEIIQYEQNLRKHIWRKNGWGDPYYQHSKPCESRVYSPAGFEYKKVSDSGTIFLVGLMDFKRKYSQIFRSMGIDNNIADALLESIYKTINDAFITGNDKGFAEGVKGAKRAQSTFDTDRLIDVFNNIELANDNLKKIIDEA